MEPAEAPDMTRGSSPCSNKAFTTPGECWEIRELATQVSVEGKVQKGGKQKEKGWTKENGERGTIGTGDERQQGATGGENEAEPV